GIRDRNVTGVQTCALPILTGEAPAVETTSSTVSAMVEGQTVRELPLNGRSFDQIAVLQPGVLLARPASTVGAPNFNGSTTWISRSEERRVGKECRIRCSRS